MRRVWAVFIRVDLLEYVSFRIKPGSVETGGRVKRLRLAPFKVQKKFHGDWHGDQSNLEHFTLSFSETGQRATRKQIADGEIADGEIADGEIADGEIHPRVGLVIATPNGAMRLSSNELLSVDVEGRVHASSMCFGVGLGQTD
jgi:hypothetical protein